MARRCYYGLGYYTKQSNMTRPGPSKTWVFIEESPYSIDDGFFAVDPRSTTIGPIVRRCCMARAVCWRMATDIRRSGSGRILQ